MKYDQNCAYLDVASNFMTDHIEIRYSKTFAYFALVVMVGLISFLTFIILTNNPKEWKGNGLFYLSIINILCFGLTVYLIGKYLIPATKRQIALVINKDCIIDNIRHNTIFWDNVKAIRNVSNRSSSFIAIDLNDSRKITGQTNNIFKKILYANNKFFYGTPILISTQYLETNNKDLLSSFLSFFDRQKLLAT